jgi:hypothetical protein
MFNSSIPAVANLDKPVSKCWMKEDRAEVRKKIVLLRELCRAVIYVT